MATTSFSTVLQALDGHPFSVLSPSIPISSYCLLNLSSNNSELSTVDVTSSDELQRYISKHKLKHKAKVAYGGYLEQRKIYNRSHHFNDSNPNAQRSIHLGLDFWIEAGTPVFAPFNGTVHSFANNTSYGDYGPTILLKHTIEGVLFYTLYGHLSLASIAHLKIGQPFYRGEQLATLGDASVNGDYPPHLHFQIIKDIEGYHGDYPGVCSLNTLNFYKANCPDPALVLRLNKNPDA